MTVPIDETDFIDHDLQASRASTAAPPSAPGVVPRPPTREELDIKVTETQNRISELKRVQEELERERTTLEEARRRRQELEIGRAEMLQHLDRGIGLLEKAEFDARRDAEQMAKTLAGFRDALEKVRSIREETWTQEGWPTELTKALTVLENARMEWNAARLKWAVLDPSSSETQPGDPKPEPADWLAARSFGGLCKLGLALTWPVALAAILALGALVIVLVRR